MLYFTFAEQGIIESGGAEPTKKLFEITNLCGACSTLVESNVGESGRTEQSTKVIGIEFVDAQVHHGLDESAQMVDVPSQ